MVGWQEFGEDALIVGTLLLLEAVLSFDNAAILAAMVRKLPVADRRKALFYGLLGAYVLRISAILLAAFLIQNPILKVLGGGYLLFLGIRHFVNVARHKAAHHDINLKPGFLRALGLPALAITIIQIELVDLAFAIDQVVVAVAFTNKVYLIIIASILGILALRVAAAVLARVMDWLPLLEHMAFVAVMYVGVKLILLHPYFGEDGQCVVPALTTDHGCAIPAPISITITIGLFAVPVLIKLIFDKPKSLPGTHQAVAQVESEANKGMPNQK